MAITANEIRVRYARSEEQQSSHDQQAGNQRTQQGVGSGQ